MGKIDPLREKEHKKNTKRQEMTRQQTQQGVWVTSRSTSVQRRMLGATVLKGTGVVFMGED